MAEGLADVIAEIKRRLRDEQSRKVDLFRARVNLLDSFTEPATFSDYVYVNRSKPSLSESTTLSDLLDSYEQLSGSFTVGDSKVGFCDAG